jgi:hypothetical protein
MNLALLVAAAAILAGSGVLAARAFPEPRRLGDRAVFAGVLAALLPIACVRALSPFAWIARGPLLALSLAVGACALVVAGERARRQALADGRAALRLTRSALTSESAAPLAWIGLGSLACAAVAAWRFAPWAWDALGYHLPIVNDAIATHTLRTVPTNIPYVNAYPRAVETFFVAVRSLLSKDTWIDFAQAPFGVVACASTAAFARRAGASPPRALAFGLAFLAVPLVMLQLATNYVDLAVAAFLAASVYFATSPALSPADVGAWALATGLLLGSKPSMPPIVTLLVLVVTVRAARAHGAGRGLAFAALGCGAVLAIGGETYVANIAAHGNPIWPIALDLGPVHLAGEDSAQPLFVQGLPAGLAQASWIHRVLVSLFVEPRDYIYDMRLGGFGPLCAWGLLPLATVAALRAPRRAWPALLLGVCALATPAAHWMRFALALPVALLALTSTAALASKWRITADLSLAVLAAVGLARALPGLSAGSTGVDGRESLWAALRETIGPGESFAYDASFSLPGQLTSGDGRSGAPVYLGSARTADDVERALAEGKARVVVAGDSAVTREAIRRSTGEYRLAFRCPLDSCDVFVRQRPESPPGVE